MELSNQNRTKASKNIIIFGLFLLLSTLLFGLLGAIEYAIPGIFRDIFSFEKIRPLHVSSAVFWIVFTAIGCVIYFFEEHRQEPLKKKNIVSVIFYLLGFTFITILISYFFGIFGGREYWEFNPIFAIPITIGWLLFIYLFISNLKTLKKQPVYVWMWFTGVLFFLFTYLESNMWLIPNIRNYLVKDMLIQWKSYGALVGSWNLLIYGSSIFLMDKISGDTKYSYSPLAFAIYFLGLFNLMFNWGHHVYTLPTAPYVQYIAYGVSMTELILFARIIYLWKTSLDTAKKYFYIESYRFLIAADVWVFLTLALAIPMSVPAINIYMHGTHTIVAHTMGATIGINTMLLLSFIAYIFSEKKNTKTTSRAYWLTNISLIVFWCVLTIAGVVKSWWEFNVPNYNYGEMMYHLRPYFYAFLVSGLGIVIGISIIVIIFLKRAFKRKSDEML